MSKLQDQLDQITANTQEPVQPERLEISERAVAELYAAGIEDRILPVGSMAPEFALPDAGGRIIRSADLLALGPLVINFFRGRWCPYCVTELETWRDLYGAVRKRGALLVGDFPQDGATKRLYCGTAWAWLSCSYGCGVPGSRTIWFGLRSGAFATAVLPQHPGEHPAGKRGCELAVAAAGNLYPGA